MEELLAVRVLEDVAGFATETLEARALEVFLFPILVEDGFRCCAAA